MRAKHQWFNFTVFALMAALALSVTFAAGYFAGVSAQRNSTNNYPVLHEVGDLLNNHYLGPLPSETVLDYGAVRGLLTAVGDPYTVFLEPPSQELETQSLQGEFGGIGVNIHHNDARDVAMTPFPDYPAIEAGIQDGDVLVAVDGVAITAKMTLDQVSAMVRGPIGTQVTITFRHGSDAPREATLIREKIEIPSVTGRILEPDATIGLVVISRFSEKTPEETVRTIDDLRTKGAEKIVLDLRGNGGGLLDSAITTAGIFLDGGVIMYEERRGEPEKTYTAPGKGAQTDLTMVVLINHGSASAAEILAGALRDRGRAPLIGQTTYGKGSVQLIFTLSDNSSVHITNARWFTPNRTEINDVGIRPDIEMEPGTDGSDPELDRAIEYLQSLP
ncbi:MAG: S41 family peptidase [Chloroflexota bacterium]